ncbi:multidrug MFS transporter [Ktedonobacter sp. SOSP1-52]|uniref:epoxide hydrolase family protein n=1 Tax=Ktedonobacter sp. SOSP1-52 TaxID=2778366 RepID=UPI001915CF95|nr:epoxide hydrolase family protein [Ktedonobacter sp. SOSP1-52]GHO66904.1 multidrug MFS transporter [Ktedonobacter sp. SOSP1-52]
MGKHPFTVHVPQAVLDDLKDRLARTRWPDEVGGAGWDYGTNLHYLKTLVDYWQHDFDWRAQEEKLNQFAHFRADIDGFGIHFIHERGRGPNPLPLLLTHGWPGSFFEMLKLIPLLTDPEGHGGDPADAFDVIVPSLPGFGFSDRPTVRGVATAQTAELWARLMRDVLDYSRFAAAGGDIGSGVTQRLALAHPGLLVGIHLTYLGANVPLPEQPDLSEAEQRYLHAVQQWSLEEGAYSRLHATKPQTLAYGLNDSPVGLAAWITEKFRTWSDCDGEVERRFSKDELLTNIMLYWVPETIASSVRMYYENAHTLSRLQPGQRITVPAGVALFPKEIIIPPREWAERLLFVQRWTEMPRGGHFSAMEEPELLAEELQAFFRPLRAVSAQQTN